MRKYTKIWRYKNLPGASSLGDLINILEDAIVELKDMSNAGIDFECKEDGSYVLCTYNKEVARTHGMQPD